ncbi:CaiB/BaiF CoA transferase family protein [Streptomyces profundus]|uniref:CaiB/BaiF CoA transferase family protein n=1 Tax=Streptomyces profundus TaxID=2867410 RepID=UPI001D167EF0|nr:CoA transferase [Streptomyces sp. MA3_2.13]UED87501.1 CoA transferase [Streptomyces sp. MA3_2.13]
MTTQPSGGPLAGLRVLDLTTFLSGPYCTLILGDLGADVIKVESPSGDATRRLPPHFVAEDSAYFLSVNRNKRSVVLDLKSEAGRSALLRMVEGCDAVVENFRAGVLDRLGLGYETLRAANPRIVLCSISGYGQQGPRRDAPAYDAIIQALSGGMSITGEEGGPPVRAGIPVGDLAAGMFATTGLLAGLYRRQQTGEGSRFDVSMLDAQVSMLTYQAAYYLLSGQVPGPQGRGHLSIPTYRSFTCGDDRDVIVTANTEAMWRGLCGVLGHDELTADPRFVDNGSRLTHRAELDALLEAAFAARDSAELLAELSAAGVPCAPVNSVADALADPQVRHRDMVIELADEAAGRRIELAGNPVKLADRTDEQPPRYPPRLGEHTEEVLREFKVPDELIASVLAPATAPGGRS